MTVTRIEDACDMRAIGWPLDPPVDREMSKGTAKHYLAVINAYAAVDSARKDYMFRGRTAAQWKLIRRTLVKLDRITAKARDFTLAERGNDDHAVEVIAVIVFRMAVFIQYWHEAIEILERGETLTINPGDIPRVFYKD